MSEASISTRFTEAYGLRHPVAAAPMTFVTNSPALPIAVCEAGALGAFAAGPFPLEFVRHNLREIRNGTQGPINLNLITLFATDEHIELCIEEAPDVVSFHWGHPPRVWIDKLTNAGIRVWEQVGTPDAAKLAVDDGIDLIVAQGSEAGGHCYGELPIFVAVPAIVDAVEGALVLAAGGIVDGRGLAAALMLGADGVLLGTRLVATDESDVAPEYKQRIVSGSARDTVLSSMFGRDLPQFNPMRVVRNNIVNEWHDRQRDIDALPEQPVVGTMSVAGQPFELRRFSSFLPVADAQGDFEQMPISAGQGLDGIRDIRPAGPLIEELISDARKVMVTVTG